MLQHNKKVERLIDEVSKMKNIDAKSKKEVLDELENMKLKIKLPKRIIYHDTDTETDSDTDLGTDSISKSESKEKKKKKSKHSLYGTESRNSSPVTNVN